MSLRKKASTGVFWISISSYVVQSVGMVTSIILARLLQPEDFGLVTLATMAVSLSNVFSQMGFGGAIVQREIVDQKVADTAFTINLFLSSLLALAVLFGSTLIAGLFNEPRLSPILKILALNIILSSISIVPSNLLERDLLFKKKVWTDILPQIVYAAITIGGALAGLRVWSLVAGILASSLLRTFLMWHISRYRPSWKFDRGIAKELFQFGQHLVYGAILLFISINLDKIYIGRYINVAQVGFYGLAFTLGNLSTEYFSKHFGRVFFPVFSRVQTDLPRFRNAYLVSLRHIAYITTPMAFGLFAIAPVAVGVVYGSKWAPVIPLIRILSFYGFFRSLGRLPVLTSIGKPYLSVRVSVLRVTILILLIIPLGSNLGAVGIAIASLLSLTFGVSATILLIKRYLSISTRNLLSQLTPQFASALVMLIGLRIVSKLLTESFLALGILIGSGIAIYVLVLWLIAGARLKQDIIDSSSPILTSLRRYFNYSP